jgi:hypothetical protein
MHPECCRCVTRPLRVGTVAARTPTVLRYSYRAFVPCGPPPQPVLKILAKNLQHGLSGLVAQRRATVRISPRRCMRGSASPFVFLQAVGSRRARHSLSDALSPCAARSARVRRVPRRVCGPARTSHSAGQRTTGPCHATGRDPHTTGGAARGHVAARRSQGHRPRLSDHAPGRTTAAATRCAERAPARGQASALGRARSPGPERPADGARRDPQRAAPEWLRDRFPPSREAPRRRARLRDRQGPRQARSAGRVCDRPAEPRHPSPPGPHGSTTVRAGTLPRGRRTPRPARCAPATGNRGVQTTTSRRRADRRPGTRRTPA